MSFLCTLFKTTTTKPLQTTEKDTEKSFTAGPIESSNPSLTPTQSISVPRLPDGSQSGFCFADATNIIHVNGVPYLRLDVIGRGGSSKVYKVLSRDYNIYALKRVRLNKKEGASLSNYANEITLLQKLRGKDHIIQLFDAEIDQKEKLLCMVSNFIKKKKKKTLCNLISKYIFERLIIFILAILSLF